MIRSFRKTFREPDADPGRTRALAGGFTIVELLVVACIMAILVGLIVGVGRWVHERGRRENTLATQKMLVVALTAYYDEAGTYPPDGGGGAVGGETLRSYLTGVTAAAGQSSAVKAALKVVGRLPSTAMSSNANTMAPNGYGGTVHVNAVFLDGFGYPMRYSQTGGAYGTPVIVSNGIDGIANTADDIYSDRH